MNAKYHVAIKAFGPFIKRISKKYSHFNLLLVEIIKQNPLKRGIKFKTLKIDLDKEVFRVDLPFLLYKSLNVD